MWKKDLSGNDALLYFNSLLSSQLQFWNENNKKNATQQQPAPELSAEKKWEETHPVILIRHLKNA